MKTIRLYDQSAYMTTCQGQVLTASGCDYIFDQSIFFPEKGGQKADRGHINGIEVLDVQEIEGQLVHHLARELESDQVKMVLDFDHRFDQMQQHCGEHILSGLLKSRFDSHNRGFHIGDQEVTLDSEKILSDKQLLVLEDLANQVIYDNLKVDLLDLSQYDPNKLRKPPAVESEDLSEIRVVQVAGVDAVTCCGTHPTRTGEIGLIKIIRADKYKGMQRISFLCGKRALKSIQMKFAVLSDLYRIMNGNDDNLVDLIQQKDQVVKESRLRINELTLAYGQSELENQWQEGVSKQFIHLRNMDQKNFNIFLKELDGQGQDFLCLFVETLCQIVIIQGQETHTSCLDLLETMKAMGAKGGGTAKRVQGKFSDRQAGLTCFMTLRDMKK